MPNIRVNEAPQGLGLNPTETGIESIAGAARRMGAYGNQIADSFNARGNALKSTVADVGQVAVDYMDHREISAGAANGAQFMANMNAKWEDTAKKADPNDPTVKQKFLDETLSPALDQFKQGFNTEKSQQWAEHFVDTYRNHMFEKTSATMASLAGEAVKVNTAKTINGLASAVAIDPSTHSIDNALSMLKHSVGEIVGSSPNIDAVTGARVTGEVYQKGAEGIVKAAVSSMIQKNPNINLDAIQKKYGEYINGAEMKMFQKAAQTQAKVDMLQQKQLETYQRQQNERAAEKAANDSLLKNVTLDPATGRPTISPDYFKSAIDIAKMPDAPQGLARTLIDWGEHQQNLKAQPQVSDPTVKQDLTDRMFSADKPTTTRDLMRAQIAGKISEHDFSVMHRMVQELEKSPLTGPVWQDTVEAVKSELILSGVGLPGKDITGVGNYSKWAQTFIPKYLEMQRAGTLPTNALDVKDPTSLISQSMSPFKRTVQQRVDDYLAVFKGTENTNKPKTVTQNGYTYTLQPDGTYK